MAENQEEVGVLKCGKCRGDLFANVVKVYQVHGNQLAFELMGFKCINCNSVIMVDTILPVPESGEAKIVAS